MRSYFYTASFAIANVAPVFLPTSPVEPSAAEVEQEIVVIGQRLDDGWRGRVRGSSKNAKCTTLTSTGDRRIDKIGCDAMSYCVKSVRADFPDPAAADSSSYWSRMTECVRRERNTRIRNYLENRSSKKR